jgi:hypothetical protein
LWLVPAFAAVLAAGPAARAQEAFTQQDQSKLESYRNGTTPVDATGKQLMEKLARHFVDRLKDQDWQKGTDPNKSMNALMREFERRLVLPPSAPGAAFRNIRENQRPFFDEFGKVLVVALDEPVKDRNPIVRLNAARMLYEVSRGGADSVAELCIKILAKPDEVDGYSEMTRVHALHALHELFAIVPEPTNPAAAAKTVFQKNNQGVLSDLERRSIQTLIDYIRRKPINDPNVPPEVQQYIRREAIRALANVRVPVVKNGANVESRPAWELLRIAQGDGLTPPPTVAERAEAITGFCYLVADRERDLQLDYAAFQIGQVMERIAQEKIANPNDQSVPWKSMATRLESALDEWQKEMAAQRLPNAALVAALVTNELKPNVLAALKDNNVAVQPNLLGLRKWLSDNPPKSPSLFGKAPETVVKSPAQ